jgi:hypothetical protein
MHNLGCEKVVPSPYSDCANNMPYVETVRFKEREASFAQPIPPNSGPLGHRLQGRG